MKTILPVAACLAVLLCASPRAAGDSFYTSVGLGMPQVIVSSNSQGMGGAGLGLRRYLTINDANPAAVELKGMTAVTAGMQADIVTHSIADASTSTRQANAAAFNIALPLYNNTALLFGFRPVTTVRFAAQKAVPCGDGNLIRTLQAKGGLNAASLGVSARLFSFAAAGVSFNYLFGSFQEVWKSDFDDGAFLDGKETITSYFHGAGIRAGLFIQPVGPLSVGAVYQAGSTLKGETTVVSGGNKTLEPTTQEIDYPAAAGIGAALNLKKVTLAVDGYSQFWKNYRVNGTASARTADYSHFAVGVEYIDRQDAVADYSRRIALRTGARISRLPFVDSEGSQVQEFVWTLGFGFPFNKNAGHIDAAVEIGERSSSSAYPYSERIVRFTVFVTAVERWFVRSY